MTDPSVTHDTFAVQRVYDATPARVFAAWARPEAKSTWFGVPEGWSDRTFDLDFRVGGREVSSGRSPEGPVWTYDAVYRNIVANRRIVYAYDMFRDDTHVSVSVATVEFEPEGDGTRLVFTDQTAYFDGLDHVGDRRHGTEAILDQLGAALARQATEV